MSETEPRLTRAERRERSRQRILAAARQRFAEVGYDRTTIRCIASAAEVDPALVMQHFGAKDALFREAVHVPADQDLPADPAQLADLAATIIGIKFGDRPEQSLALLRSMFTTPDATAEMRTRVQTQIQQAAAAMRSAGVDYPDLRAALLMSVLLGASVCRNLLEIAPLRDATGAEIADVARPSLRAITGTDPANP